MTPIRDSRAVKLQKVLSGDYIPLYSGRPVRDQIINSDDLIDLKILLNSTTSVEHFISKL